MIKSNLVKSHNRLKIYLSFLLMLRSFMLALTIKIEWPVKACAVIPTNQKSLYLFLYFFSLSFPFKYSLGNKWMHEE